MYAVEVRDHIMIAHSFPSPVFGPAQGVHGATFTVDAAFFAEDIDEHGLVVDIGLAIDALAQVLEPLRYKNLDDESQFKGTFTTTEFLSGHIFRALAEKVRAGELKDAKRVKRLRITLHESHLARGWFEAEI
ncbi:6-pyruvoyl trahydropterin synthase family protein [Roseicitreum antarcticum]|uniref:6-carboxy-5,6,7,8-tetrahydropterin synthase n=1 Tax=Roseicitreum antarcticum TaxID=564137 RepID=A0A1H2TH68_9RHOB|nr:6-carboxytetrahydropterin synthase [Roseicitreum antarcticum]SDW43316.1 6-pyruvoyl-tetrahydropterin synthase [Roseicitreum antarcticum]